MTVSKRLRFEILRRDNHTCHYCGRSAPEVKLTIDHVVPVTLGGEDTPDNLLTACSECNAGKTSLPPDAAIVEDVGVRTFIWRTALDMAWADWRSRREETRAACEVFDVAWRRWTANGQNAPRDGDWQDSIETWLGLGFTVEEIAELIPKAHGAYNRGKVRGGFDGLWAYFCGIVWGTIKGFQRDTTDYIEAANDEAVRAERAKQRADAIQAKLEQEEWYLQESMWWRDEDDDYLPMGSYAGLAA